MDLGRRVQSTADMSDEVSSNLELHELRRSLVLDAASSRLARD